MMAALTKRRIAIVGAGPAGLTAARILQTSGLDTDVFEAENNIDARTQGGTLDLHPDSGQHALERASLMASFRAVARYEDQGTRLLDFATATPLFEEVPSPGEGDRPEIDRKALRRLLLDNLAPGTVTWGARLRDVAQEQDGRHRLVFADRATEPYDLVVGADGAWSKVRAVLSDVMPNYTGVTFIEFWIDDVDHLHPEIARLVGRGTMFALHAGRGLVAQRNGSGHLRIYAVLQAANGWSAEQGLDPAEPARLRQNLTHLFLDWSPRLLALIEHALEVAFVRPIVALPVDFRWSTVPGITLVGDAAHVMPPVGRGVNLAMLDAADLADELSRLTDWHEATSRFEAKMMQRAQAESAEARIGFLDLFGMNAPRSALEHMINRGEPGSAQPH
jgi:2-polyprenyl-6-methoxyphenol hydroxylase-like FAD-dependent oxidoreductase